MKDMDLMKFKVNTYIKYWHYF